MEKISARELSLEIPERGALRAKGGCGCALTRICGGCHWRVTIFIYTFFLEKCCGTSPLRHNDIRILANLELCTNCMWTGGLVAANR